MLKDTSPQLEEIYINKLKQKNNLERALMGFSMFEMAREIVKASLREKHPNIDILNIKIGVFNRFYGNDFNQKIRDNIIRHLAKD